MNVKKIKSLLKKKYPGKKIIVTDSKSSGEIIVEIEPTANHPERSLALAVVGKSKLHYHKKSTEIYEAVKDELTVYIEGKKHVLKEKGKVTIKPGQIHYAEGDEAWFLTHSRPGWTFEDHILVFDKDG